MAVHVRLEDEKRTNCGETVDSTHLIRRLTNGRPEKHFRLLRYIDPYGDTMFNELQVADLLADLADVAPLITDEDEVRFLAEVRALAEQTAEGALYLWFYGD